MRAATGINAEPKFVRNGSVECTRCLRTLPDRRSLPNLYNAALSVLRFPGNKLIQRNRFDRVVLNGAQIGSMDVPGIWSVILYAIVLNLQHTFKNFCSIRIVISVPFFKHKAGSWRVRSLDKLRG